jgi:hypothetical protein
MGPSSKIGQRTEARRRSGGECYERHRAVCVAVSDHGARHSCSTDAVRVIAKSISEVGIVTQAV